MKLPKHINLMIEHNPHRANYETVTQWLDDENRSADVTDDDSAEMLATDEIWVIHWYPETMVGFCAVAAATLEKALERANAE